MVKNFDTDKLKLNEEGQKRVEEYAREHNISEEAAKVAIMRELIAKARRGEK